MSTIKQPIIIIDRTDGLINNVISTIPDLKVIVIDEDYELDSCHTNLPVPGLSQNDEYFFTEANVTTISQEEAEKYDETLNHIFAKWIGDEKE